MPRFPFDINFRQHGYRISGRDTLVFHAKRYGLGNGFILSSTDAELLQIVRRKMEAEAHEHSDITTDVG